MRIGATNAVTRVPTFVVQPGRPDAQKHSYDEPRVLVVRHDTGEVHETGRKIKLHGTWTLRQYRNPTACGAQFALHPGPDATYQWEVLD